MSEQSNINPSTGLVYRNPTHIMEANNADDQSEIVKSIRATGVKRMVVKYDYSDIDKQSPPPLAGITKIREMTPERAKNYCKQLMRSKPNIFRMNIKLGDYPNQRRIDNSKTRLLNANKARFNTEIGEKLGGILADKTMLVTEVKYNVENTEPGMFNAIAEVYGTTEEEYNNDELFKPTITFEFIKTH